MSSAALSQETTEKDGRDLLKIASLQDKLDKLRDSELPIKSISFVPYIFGGYATAVTLGWWISGDQSGSWFFYATGGAGMGLFAFAFKEQSAKWLFKKIKIMKDLRRLLQSENLNSQSIEVLSQSLSDFFVNFDKLLKDHRMGTSLERWIWLGVLEDAIQFARSHSLYDRPLDFLGLAEALSSLKQIEADAVYQKDLPLILRTSKLKSRLIGLMGSFLKSKHWNELIEWINWHDFEREYVLKAISKFEASRSFSLSGFQVHQESLKPPFFLKVEPTSSGKMTFIFTERSNHIRPVAGFSWASFLKSLPEGLWVRYVGLEQRSWEYLLDDDLIAFSERYSIGEVELSKNPFQHLLLGDEDPRVIRKEFKRPTKIGEVRRKLQRELRAEGHRFEVLKLPGRLKSSCHRFLKSF